MISVWLTRGHGIFLSNYPSRMTPDTYLSSFKDKTLHSVKKKGGYNTRISLDLIFQISRKGEAKKKIINTRKISFKTGNILKHGSPKVCQQSLVAIRINTRDDKFLKED